MSQSIIIKSILIIALLILILFTLIVLARSILGMIIYISRKNYQKIKKSTNNFFVGNKNFNKEDEELMRYKNEIPKAHSQTKADKIAMNSQKKYQIIDQHQEAEEEVFVGVAEPLGFWTRKIFGERIATIMAQAESLKKGESTKFWQNFVKASRAQSRQQDRF